MANICGQLQGQPGGLKKKNGAFHAVFLKRCGPTRARSWDPLIMSQVL